METMETMEGTAPAPLTRAGACAIICQTYDNREREGVEPSPLTVGDKGGKEAE